MPAITRSRLESNFGQDSRKSLSEHSATSMLGAFNQEKSYNNLILLQKLEAGPPLDKVVEKFATNLNKMALETN